MNYDQNEQSNQNNEQKPDFDPSGETKQKILFFVVAIIVVIIAKFVIGL